MNPDQSTCIDPANEDWRESETELAMMNLTPCRSCGSLPAPHSNRHMGHWLLCTGPTCDRETDACGKLVKACGEWNRMNEVGR